jgi:hypothetical protein
MVLLRNAYELSDATHPHTWKNKKKFKKIEPFLKSKMNTSTVLIKIFP